MEAVERAAYDSCWWASDTTATEACDGECLDEREVADLVSRDKPAALGCSSSRHIRRDGECCWLEALLRCHDQRLTPDGIKKQINHVFEKL